MGAESRKIEKYGILKLLPEDRGAQNLIVLCDVIQLPYTEYLNVKSNPPKGHYGFACFMYKEYVRAIVDIQFRRQVIFEHQGYVVQLAHQEYCNSKEIATQVGTLWNPTPIDYPILNFDEIRFKLEDGVIISVLKSSIPMKTCDSQGIIQPDLSPPSSYNPPPPKAPPGKDAEPSELIPLSLPYEGADDNGNTFVRAGSKFSYTVKTTFSQGQGDCEFIGQEASETFEFNEPNVQFSFEQRSDGWYLTASNGFVRQPRWVSLRCLPSIVEVTQAGG